MRYLEAWRSDPEVNQIQFRAGEKLSAKTESALKYRIADHLQKYLELESVLGAPAAFENPLADWPGGTGDEVERAAAEVRGRWELGTGPVVNLLGLLEDKGIKVYETRGIEGFEGLSGAVRPVSVRRGERRFPARPGALHRRPRAGPRDVRFLGRGEPRERVPRVRRRVPAAAGGAREAFHDDAAQGDHGRAGRDQGDLRHLAPGDHVPGPRSGIHHRPAAQVVPRDDQGQGLDRRGAGGLHGQGAGDPVPAPPPLRRGRGHPRRRQGGGDGRRRGRRA
ncbi:MAG: hypothetical protein M0C28_04030 [Candidatus Moduliflexus flocculans]|nr:hypothetical protein [Candidatus Moduliflexus flocculans]